MTRPIDSDDVLSPEREKVTRPAKRWRNKWWARRPGITKLGEFHGAGEYWSSREWPSREVAETKAKEEEERLSDRFKSGEFRYLGAFPEPAP